MSATSTVTGMHRLRRNASFLLTLQMDHLGNAGLAQISGVILLDGLLQTFLLGTIVTQSIGYWTNYPDDSWRKRVFVAIILALSILQTILEDFKVWRTLVFRREWSTSPIEWSDLFLNGCICAICQTFYIRRCWKMTKKSSWVIYPLASLSGVIMAANIYLAAAMGKIFRSTSGTDDTLTKVHFIVPSTIVSFSVWAFGSLVLDVTVTSILAVSLWRSRIGITQIDATILYIIRITWESAALPMICMVVAVALYNTAPRVDDHLVIFFVLTTGKLYSLGILRTLNSRVRLRERMRSHDLGRMSLNRWQWEQASTNTGKSTRGSEPDAFSQSCGLVGASMLRSQAEGVAPNDGGCLSMSASRIDEKDPETARKFSNDPSLSSFA